MAESIKLSVEADSKAIFVYDETGSYDKSCNPGGWGAPNLEPSDVETVTLEVYKPESTTATSIDVTTAFPNKDGIGFEILASDLGLTEITSGVWKFVYTTSSPSCAFTDTFTIQVLLDDVIACCVDKLLVDTNAANLLSESNTKKVEMEILLNNARWAAEKEDFTGAQKIAKHLNLQCKCFK